MNSGKTRDDIYTVYEVSSEFGLVFRRLVGWLSLSYIFLLNVKDLQVSSVQNLIICCVYKLSMTIWWRVGYTCENQFLSMETILSIIISIMHWEKLWRSTIYIRKIDKYLLHRYGVVESQNNLNVFFFLKKKKAEKECLKCDFEGKKKREESKP